MMGEDPQSLPKPAMSEIVQIQQVEIFVENL